MKSKAAGCGSISIVISSIVLLCVSSIIIIITIIIIIATTIIKIIVILIINIIVIIIIVKQVKLTFIYKNWVFGGECLLREPKAFLDNNMV